MKGILTRLSKRRFPYQPLIVVKISYNRLIHNLRQFMKLAPQHAVAPVLKSNAYGHGLVEIAKILELERRKSMIPDPKYKTKKCIPFFVIDSYFEAVSLRSAGIKTPLLVIGYTRPETIARARLRNVSFTITSLDTLRKISHYQFSIFNFTARKIHLHLKIDTGMHRQGILPEEIDEISSILETNPSLSIRGICSHFSDADNKDPSFTESQIHTWNEVVKKLTSKFTNIEHIHISNTDGHRYSEGCHATVSRLGLGLYGLVDAHSGFHDLDSRPVLSMETIITSIKKIKRDQTVGYGNTFKAEKDLVIATIPVGYYEGVDRRLSNIGTIRVGTEQTPCRIVGRISMNITIIDVTHIPSITIDTPVTVISDSSSHENSIISMAKKCHTIPYEIAVHIPAHLRRVIC